MPGRILLAMLALLAVPSAAGAQPSPVYVGASLHGVTQTHSDSEPMGGTVAGGSVVFGVWVSPRVAVELEPSFGGLYSWEYRYRPSPSLMADVVASRRDAFYSLQVRTRIGVLEPVAGVSYVRGRIGRHATIGGTTYFDESRTDQGLAAVAGLDAAVKVASHVYVVPTVRALARARENSADDPLGDQARPGRFLFRYGAGVRVTF